MCFPIFFTTGHDKLPVHSKLKTWDRVDIERLIHKLTLEGYLIEELVTNQMDIVNAYLKVIIHVVIDNVHHKKYASKSTPSY